MARFQEVSVSAVPGKTDSVKSLLDFAIAFGKQHRFSVFELIVSGFKRDFFEEAESKSFFIFRVPKGFAPKLTSPNTMRVPIIGIKGALNPESAEFLLSQKIIDKLGAGVLSILIRERSPKEAKAHFLSSTSYKSRKCWLRVSTDRALFGNLRIAQLKEFYRQLSKLGKFHIFFDAPENILMLCGEEEVKGLERLQKEIGLKKITSIDEFVKGKRITTIQLSQFTKKQLQRIGKRNLEKTIIRLLQEAGY